ncbi:MAG: TlpA family protein disulfide reductase [Planctomyces sp.]|nr:TlpA family protein disulfide reductase [Planctomyces sp.]
MRRSQCLIRLFLLTTAIVGALISSLRAEQPPAAAILETYRANASKLTTLHLQVVQRQEWTDAFRESHRLRAEQQEALLKSLGEDPGQSEALGLPEGYSVSQFIETMRQQARHAREFENNREIEHRYEIFVDGDDYQLRTLWTWTNEPPEGGWAFPASNVTPESLPVDYALCRIYSRSSLQAPPARIWPGQPRPDSAAHVMLTEQHAGGTQSLDLPPFTAFMWVPLRGTRHPIDEFFSGQADDYRVVGTETVEGRELTIVDVILATEFQSGVQEADGSVTLTPMVNHYRAWLDLSRGALPLTLHRWQRLQGYDLSDADRKQPQKVTTVAEVRTLENGAFYPAATACDDYQLDPKASNFTQEQWAEVREGKRTVKQVVFDRMTWMCDVVRTDYPHDDAFFVLNFSNEQPLFDLDAGKAVGAIEQQPPLPVGQPAPPLQTARWVDGETRQLEDFRGQVVLLDFWGLWCGPCRGAVPANKLLQERFQGQPVVFISVHTAGGDPEKLAGRIAEFARQQEWNYLAAIDAGTMIENSQTCAAYGVQGFPTHMVIGRDGRVTFNSGLPPAGLEDLFGKSCDEATPEDEARMEAFQKAQFEAAGETYPPAEGLSQAELSEVLTRVSAFHLTQEIAAALAAEPAPE